MKLGERIKALRLDRGLTQGELAGPTYTASYVSTIEAGKRTPSRAAIEHFAHKLGVDPDELASGRDPGRRAQMLVDYVEARRALASGRPESINEAERLLEKLRRAARREGVLDIEAKARLGIGLCAEARNELASALAIYEEILALLRDESPVARVDAVVGRARVLQTKGEVAFAAFLIEEALAELRELEVEDPASLVRLNSSLVAAYFAAGLLDRAMDAAKAALDLSVAVSDPERLANMNLNVGIMLAQSGHWRQAEERLAAAERWFDELQYETDLARVRLVRGINLRNQGRFDEARPHLLAARQVFAESGNALREARAAVALGTLERAAGHSDEAVFILKQALSLAGDDRGIAGIAQRELSLCHATRDRKAAIRGLRKAISLLEEAGLSKELATTYRAVGDLLAETEELSPAGEAYRLAAVTLEQAA